MKIGNKEFSRGEVFAGSLGAGLVLGFWALGTLQTYSEATHEKPSVTTPDKLHCTGQLGALAVVDTYKGGTTWRVTSIATAGEGDQSCVSVSQENGQKSNVQLWVGTELSMACKYNETAPDIRIEIVKGDSTFYGVAPVDSNFLRNQTLGMCSSPAEPSPLGNR